MPDDQVTQPKPTFSQYVKSALYSIGNFCIRYPLAVAGTVLVLALAIFMAIFGKQFQIGGILGWLWGKKTSSPDVRGVVPQNRVDDKGQPIPVGESDKKGWVQAPVSTEIKQPTIFSDPNTITVVHPDKGEVTIPLPTGVKNKDVATVIEIQPNLYQVASHDKGVNTDEVLKILK